MLSTVVSSITKVLDFINVMDALKSIYYFFYLSPKDRSVYKKLLMKPFRIQKKKVATYFPDKVVSLY